MPIPEQQLEYLRKVGVSQEQINKIQESVNKAGETALASGAAYKSSDDATQRAAQPETETPAPTGQKRVSAEDPITREEIADAIKTVVENTILPLVGVIEAQKQRLDTLEKAVGGVTSMVQQETPDASLKSLLGFSQGAVVDGRSSLARQQPSIPEQYKSQEPAEHTGHSIVDAIINQADSGNQEPDDYSALGSILS